ncbi:MAG TPA: hypothetical protein VLI45_00755, partial [Acidobacteriaceae bacterium]|nr:hypothetical protein [Acidobacteriaceae bacterium]
MSNNRNQNHHNDHGNGRPQNGTQDDAHRHVSPDRFDLAQAALEEMHEAGFRPEFGPGVAQQLNDIRANEEAPQEAADGIADLRALPWSS